MVLKASTMFQRTDDGIRFTMCLRFVIVVVMVENDFVHQLRGGEKDLETMEVFAKKQNVFKEDGWIMTEIIAHTREQLFGFTLARHFTIAPR